MQQSKVPVKYFEENSVFAEVSYQYLFNLEGGGGGWGGRLFVFKWGGVGGGWGGVGAYSRWALIRGWALIRINAVLESNFYQSFSLLIDRKT